jgi:NitT/TauT family transport system substrate-binding protein
MTDRTSSTMQNRRVVLGGLLAAAAVGRGRAAVAQTTALKVTVGAAPIIPYTNYLIASDLNYYADAGITVERKTIFAPDVARTALISGDIDIAATAIDAIVRGHLAGFDWKILYPAVMYDASRPDAEVVVRTDVPAKTPKELEGKTIALPIGGMGETAFKAWMRAEGGDASKVNVVEVPFPQMLPALQAKRIEGANMLEPGLTQALELGVVRIIGPNLDIVGKRYLVAAYVARAGWISANPQKAKGFVDAVARATRFVLDHPNEALPLVVKETKLDPSLAAKLFPVHYVAATEVTGPELQIPIDFMAREKFIPASFSYRDLISSYLPVKS